MLSGGVVVTGEKETFFIKVLVKKLKGRGIASSYVPVGELICDGFLEAAVVIYYMEEKEVITGPAIDFFRANKLSEEKKLIIIGCNEDTDRTVKELGECSSTISIYDRPLDDDRLVGDVAALFDADSTSEEKKSILIIDDEPNYMVLVREWLKEKYSVSMVTGGELAFKWLSKNKCDLILLDYEMPVMNGPAVLKELKEGAENCKIPVLFLTGRSESESDALSTEGAEGLIYKTVERDELLEKLNSFFEKQRNN
jgi:CheY-like chemotaxis protein